MEINFTAWDDFYDPITSESDSQQYYLSKFQNTPQPINDSQTNSIYVLRCLFSNCSFWGYGGAIKITNSKRQFLSEFSTFYYCSSEFGGSICFSNTSSNCFLNRICSFKSSADDGQFIYTIGMNQVKILQSSITSIKEIEGTYSPLRLESRNQNCTFVNVSNYKVHSYSALFYYSATSESILIDSNICSNEAKKDRCLNFEEGISYKAERCNIIKNSGDATFYCNSNTAINDCCILDNTGEGDWTLFYQMSSSCHITVRNCTLQSESNRISGSVIIVSTANPTFIHTFELIPKDVFCHETSTQCTCIKQRFEHIISPFISIFISHYVS